MNNSEWNFLHVTDMQIDLLGEKYSLALIENSAFDAYDSILTNLVLYLTNVNSLDFSRTSSFFSPSVKLNLSGEKPVSRDKFPLSLMLKFSCIYFLLLIMFL